MLDPWRWCDADNEEVADFLASTVHTLIELGGWIHPEARIVARDGDLRIDCSAPEGEPLIRVPVDAMLPITRVDWSDSNQHLSIDAIHDWPDSANLALLLTQIGLHNSCSKIPRLASSHPSASADFDEELIAAIRELRPTFRTRPMSPAQVFWATRTFRLPAFSTQPEPVAIPLVDALNHHPDGALGQWHDGSFTVDIRRPTRTSECFVNYGHQRDALDTALVYGFVDRVPEFAHSAPVSLTIPEVGSVSVLDHGRSPDGEILPLVAEYIDGTWILNRLTFHGPNTLSSLLQITGETEDWCRHVLDTIARANVELLERLEFLLTSGNDHPAQSIVAGASEHQRSILNRFLKIFSG